MKYKVLVFGCQMNKNDAERIRNYLDNLGAEETDNDQLADLFIMVACSVRQKAVDRLYGLIKKWKQERKDDFKTLVTGCINELDRKKMKDKFDLILNINDLASWSLYLKKYFPELQNFDNPELDYFHILPKNTKNYSVYLPIMTGCNNFCSYCIVPFVRGREKSRSVKEVLEEAKYLVQNGAKEIILLGQNVNSYAPEDLENFSSDNPYKESNFAKLLWELNKMEGIERLHFTASHPKNMHDELIDAFHLEKLVNYLHLPLQSGSNSVLRRMNRHYTIEDYKKIIDKIRKVRPNIALGTDLIVGFCGETDEEFQETVKAYEDIAFDISYTAQYSERPGTIASKTMKDDISPEIKKARWNELQALMEKITKEKNKEYKGQIVSVLFDDYDENKKYLSGNSREMKRVIIKNVLDDSLLGTIKNVKITDTDTWVLWGELI